MPLLLALALLLLSVGGARAADNFFLDLVVGSTGHLVGDGDDRFFVSRDFLNASTQNTAWNTAEAELVLQGGVPHVLALAGTNHGPVIAGLVHNFAWGALRVKVGNPFALQDGNANAGAAQYVSRLILEGGLPQIASITGNGFSIYYDPGQIQNAYLAGGTYPLSGGGVIAPMAVPAPALHGWGAALLALGFVCAGCVRSCALPRAR